MEWLVHTPQEPLARNIACTLSLANNVGLRVAYNVQGQLSHDTNCVILPYLRLSVGLLKLQFREAFLLFKHWRPCQGLCYTQAVAPWLLPLAGTAGTGQALGQHSRHALW